MQMDINMHIHKPGHASQMTRSGWIQLCSIAYAPLSRALLLAHKRLLQPQCHICHQKAQFCVLSSVCIVPVNVPLYSDSSCVELYTLSFRLTGRFACRAHSRHQGSSWAGELNIKDQIHLTTPR